MVTLDHSSPALRRRVLVWGGLLLGAALIFFALLVFLAPKVINQHAVRSKIETTISSSLGGTATFDRLDLVLVPRPELEITGLKIVIPGTASASIARVGIYAKLLPLLLGRFELSSVVLDRPALDIALPSAASRKTSLRKPPPAGRSVDEVLAVAAGALPDVSLKIVRGRLALARDAKPVLLLDDLEVVAAFAQGPRDGRDRSGDPTGSQYSVTGRAQCTIGGLAGLPGPLRLSVKGFDAQPGRLSLTAVRARLLDGEVSLNGTLEDPFSAEPRPNVALSGSIGRETADWLRSLAGLPSDLSLHAPIAVSKTHLRTSGTGSAQTLTGSASVDGGAAVAFSLRRDSGRLSVEKLHIRDRESDALLSFLTGAGDRTLSFAGVLTKNTLNNLFTYERLTFGSIKGDMRVLLPADDLAEVSAEGTLDGERIGIPSSLAGGFLIDRFSVRADGSTLFVQPLVLSLGTDTLSVQGSAIYGEHNLALDLDVLAGRIDLRTLRELVRRDRSPSEGADQPPARRPLTVVGELRMHAAALSVDRYTFDDPTVVLTIGRDRNSMTVQQASLCGIGLTGTLVIEGRTADLTARANVRSGAMEKSLHCILQEEAGFSGPYDLSGRFTGRGTWEALLGSLQGSFELSSTQGRVHSKRIVKGIIAYLNSTSMFKGSRSDLLDKGFSYDAIAFRGSLKEGMITLSEGTIRSREVHITAEGDVDLRNGTLALNVLAAPFTSLDRLLGKIPIVKYLAGNALIVVPARVEGTFSDPKVKPLALSGVGTNVTNLMKNIVKAPVKVVDPDGKQ